MKTIGLVGGLTWYSSVDYYRYINLEVNRRVGGDHAARIILNSVNFGDIKKLTLADDWDSVSSLICEAAKQVEKAGADCLLIGANTMHHIAKNVSDAINIPLIHIADATAKAIVENEISTVALLGTKYTMQFDFFKNKLSKYGITTLIPDEYGIGFVNKSIYEELGKGLVLSETKEKYKTIINQLVDEGAKGIILGCTEIPLLIKQEDCPIPVFDTTLLHVNAAVDFVFA